MHKFIFAHNSEKGRSKRKWPNETLSNDFASQPKHPLPGTPPPTKGIQDMLVSLFSSQLPKEVIIFWPINEMLSHTYCLFILTQAHTHTSTLYTSFVSLYLIFNNKDLFNTVYEYESESEWVYVSESVTMNVSG